MSEAFGRLQDGVHVLRVPVYYEDTDAGGVVYHANYLKYGERARSDLLRILGIEQSRLDIVFVVRHCEIDFKAPAHLDDVLEVHTWLAKVKGASLDAEHSVRLGDRELAYLKVCVVSVDVSEKGKPVRLPAEIRASLEGLCRTNSGT